MGEIAILTKEHLAWRRSQGGDGDGGSGESGGWGWQLYGFYHGFIMWVCLKMGYTPNEIAI
jgi:hypothetical protein